MFTNPSEPTNEPTKRVGLSLSPCHRRVKALEQSGVIRGYRAHLDPAFQQLYDEKLSDMPRVQRLTSTLVMKTVIQDRPLPP
jgi:hypothetical protein